MDDIRVLCKRCAENYRTAGYKLYCQNRIKQKCHICDEPGFEYSILKPKRRGGKIGK